MELGELGEPMYERGLLVLFREEKKFSVALRERTKRRGLLCSWCWLISNGRGLRLNKGIGSKVSGFVFRGSWSLEEATRREPV